MPDVAHLPYLQTLLRLFLALGIGLFIGIERERRRKEAGSRTFAFAALLGALGGLLGEPYALSALGLVGLLVVLLNVDTIRGGEGPELTTSAALFITVFAGVLAGLGHTFTPVVLGVVTAGLLTWKTSLSGFSQALTESELRSAILLALLAFVIYPILPPGHVDRWQLVDLRAAWVTVILIAALGFLNYVLLKLYGARGLQVTSFLGGLVNSTATVADLAGRAAGAGHADALVVHRCTLLATSAMLLRNGVILAGLAPEAWMSSAVPFLIMVVVALLLAFRRRVVISENAMRDEPALTLLRSPFSLTAALEFGVLYLALQVAGELAERASGSLGFYVVSAAGGMISSASAVASAATLVAGGQIGATTGATAAVIASLTSALVSIPIVLSRSRNRELSRGIVVALITLVVCGLAGATLTHAWIALHARA